MRRWLREERRMCCRLRLNAAAAVVYVRVYANLPDSRTSSSLRRHPPRKTSIIYQLRVRMHKTGVNGLSLALTDRRVLRVFACVFRKQA